MKKTSFQSAKWADYNNKENTLVSFHGEQPVRMVNSDGTAKPLVLDDSLEKKFGADIIRFDAGKGVRLHTHRGAHILLVTKGTGVLTYYEEKHPMFEGMIYMIPSNVPHAIDATTELVLIAVGNEHQPADSEARLEIVS